MDKSFFFHMILSNIEHIIDDGDNNGIYDFHDLKEKWHTKWVWQALIAMCIYIVIASSRSFSPIHSNVSIVDALKTDHLVIVDFSPGDSASDNPFGHKTSKFLDTLLI